MSRERDQPAEAPVAGPPPRREEHGRWQRYGRRRSRSSPRRCVFLGVWIVYPTIRTIVRSFFDREGDDLRRARQLRGRSSRTTRWSRRSRTTSLWLAIVPALVTAIGLVFAVLLERVRLSVAFKTAVFMPMAISLFAAGVIWRLMYEQGPRPGRGQRRDRGREGRRSRRRACSPTRSLDRRPHGQAESGLHAEDSRSARRRRPDGPHGDPPEDVPDGAEQAVAPPSRSRAGSPASSGETSSPAAATPGERRAGRARAARRDRRAARRRRRHGRGRRRPRRRHVRLRRRRAGQLPAAIGAGTFEAAVRAAWRGSARA